MRRIALPAVFAALLLLPAAAPAKVVQAEDILPPGQSGFVSATGLTSGTGSPHLYDQQPGFINFTWKPHLFQAGTEEFEPKPGVKITRDAFGVPTVNAGAMEDAWFGVGYAVAQDRLFQLELFQRATTGHLAEVVGKSYVDDDVIARRDYYTAEERLKMWRALPADLQARGKAYRDGVNAYITRVRNNPMEMPAEFAATGSQPSEFTEEEQVAIGIFLARTVPSGDGRELENLIALRAAGKDALDALVPIRQARETYTIPPSEATFKSQPGRTVKQERAAYKRTVKASAGWDVPAPKAAARASAQRAIGGSSMFAVKGSGGKAYLFSGPQLGYSVPELFVEYELHYPGFDVRGVSAAGVPVVGIGHNGTVAWGITSGLHDEDDLYAEQLVGDTKSETYRFKGKDTKMDCRDEVIRWQTPPSDVLLGGEAPGSGEQTERVCRTVHGPVQVRAGRTAYARRYAIWNREVDSLIGLDMVNRARSIGDVDQGMNNVTWNENLMAVDSQGNIGYWHPGLHQLRPFGYDERLPYPGTGEAEWRGLRDRKATPRVINPKQGWLANWNNLPAKGWTTGDAESNERLSAQFHRGNFLKRAVERFHKAGATFRGAQDVIRYAGTHAQQRPLASARIKKANRGATGTPKAIFDALLAWDGSYHRTADDGTVDPGVAIWEEFKDRLEAIKVGQLGKGAEELAGGTGNSHAFDISNGEAYAVRTASTREWRKAAEATHAALAKKFGSDDVARWREPRRLYDVGAQGAGSAPPLPFFDRGTWEQFVEVGP
jgi:penicillin amidase